MTCAGCLEDVTVTLVVTGRGERSHLCKRCYFAPKEVFVPRSGKGKK